MQSMPWLKIMNPRLRAIAGLIMLTLLLVAPQPIVAKAFQSAIPDDFAMKGFIRADFGDIRVFMPDSGAGKNILLPLTNNDSVEEYTRHLKKILGNDSANKGVMIELTPENKYEEDLVAKFPDLRMYSINKLLPAAVQERFNRKLDFGGPNCFYTALSATDGIEQNEIRHVSLNEFKARLALLYTAIPGDIALPGDVLLFNSSDHGAVYLGGDRVFHKKDLNKEYYFRIPRKLEVFMPDKGEWAPGDNYCGPYSRPHDTKVSKIQIFRRNQTPLATWNSTIVRLPEFGLINLMKTSAMQTAPQWKLGKVMGYWSEILSEELVRAFDSTLKEDSNGAQLMSELESTRDQIFISIEDNYFSSPYAKEKIIKEIWFFDNEYSRKIIRLFRTYSSLETSEEDIVRISAAIKAIDGEPRGKSLLAIMLK